MKTAEGKRLENGCSVSPLGRNAAGGNDRLPEETIGGTAKTKLSVLFLEGPEWEPELTEGAAPSLRGPCRVIAVSNTAGLPGAAPPPAGRNILAEKIAWAMLRVRAMAECLGAA